MFRLVRIKRGTPGSGPYNTLLMGEYISDNPFRISNLRPLASCSTASYADPHKPGFPI